MMQKDYRHVCYNCGPQCDKYGKCEDQASNEARDKEAEELRQQLKDLMGDF